jgi:RNA polymerase sigma-70 factor (ECF subfamily)
MRVENNDVEKLTFSRFYAQHFKIFTLLALQYVKDVIVAENIVQDAFLKFWEAPFTLDKPDAIKSYFGKIIINNALNYLKREKSLQRHHDEIGKNITEQDVYEKLYESELMIRIHREIAKLPAQCRRVFRMNRFEGLKYREISKLLNISERTVENHIAYALKTLRKKLLKDDLFKADLQQYKTVLLILGLC